LLIKEKKNIVEDIHKRFIEANLIVNTDYQGLDVTDITDLRKKLKDASVQFKVVKNTLLEKASINTNAEILKDSFKGPSAVALSYDDPVETAKILIKFSEEKPNFVIKKGSMDGKLLSDKDIKALSLLPSREILLSQFLSVLSAVPGGFVRTLNAIPNGFVNLLQAYKDKKENDS